MTVGYRVTADASIPCVSSKLRFPVALAFFFSCLLVFSFLFSSLFSFFFPGRGVTCRSFYSFQYFKRSTGRID